MRKKDTKEKFNLEIKSRNTGNNKRARGIIYKTRDTRRIEITNKSEAETKRKKILQTHLKNK